MKFQVVQRGALAILLVVGTTAFSHADPAGLWREKDGGTVRIHHCGRALCGTTASVNPALDPATGKPWTDKHNEDETKRNRPLVGLQVLISMRPVSPGKWSGKLYDTDRGQIFSGNLVEIDQSTIRVEGCVMGICGGEEMTRVSR
jgi:uncharacterized protein (DUF2147 family)